MSKKVTINQGRVVPIQFRFAGSIFVFMIMALSLQNLPEYVAIVISVLVSFFLPLVWSTYSVMEILPEEHLIKEGYWIMGIKKMDSQKYTSFDKVFINSHLSSETMHARGGQSSTFTNKEFHAFLKTTEGKKYELISSKSEEDIVKRLEPIVKKLELTIDKNY
ncbi:MAG: hypothetical protein CMB80_24180 [Flammeovirgaceae bacterium]|nr:hypothetical protein [Flammeovirgaceae bacterium]MBE61569.1 hypothetical protein [Flammeovirgaceae bacterium]HCX22970.1 hypothetical protein [Cytophagales bacterium]